MVLGGDELLTGYPVAHEWQARHGALVEGQRLVPRLPFVTGGAFEIDNLCSAHAVEGMRARGSLAVQIRDLPDGAKIRYRIVEWSPSPRSTRFAVNHRWGGGRPGAGHLRQAWNPSRHALLCHAVERRAR